VLLAVLTFIPAAFAGNGTANYLDFDGTNPGFGSPSDTSQSAFMWSTSAAGTATTTALPSGAQMTIGAVASDFLGSSPFTITMNVASNMQGIIINSANVNVTLIGTGNSRNSSNPNIWSITNGSTLTMNDTRQLFATGVNGYNWNNVTVTFQGGGTYNFQTPFGANSTASNVCSLLPTGILNLLMSPVSTVSTYSGGFYLNSGTLNFASAGSTNAFNGFIAGRPFVINGGILDNTSGNPLTLNVGVGGVSLNGDVTFTGSSSLDFGAAAVTNTAVNRNITVNANTLGFSSVISGPGNGITKLGAGTLQFAGTNTYSGPTFIAKGTFALTNNGSIASSPLIVSNSTFDVSGANLPVSLTSLSVTNSTLVVSCASFTATNILAPTLNVGGTTNLINITSLPLATSYPMVFHILQSPTVTGTLNFGLGTLPVFPAYVGYISNNVASGLIDLVITNGPAPVSQLSWRGINSGTDLPDGTWDAANTFTWLKGAVPTNFNTLDFVTLDDSAAGLTTLSLSGGLQPGSLTVSNNAKTYTFTGGGIMDSPLGALTLNKRGSGTLLLQEGGDIFTGGINASAGTVIIDTDASGITGGATIASGATVQLGTNDTLGVLPTGPIADNGTLLFNRADNFIVNNSITGSGVVKHFNTNMVTLAGVSSGSWSTVVTNGILQVVNSASLGSLPGGSVTITNRGTLDLGGDTTANDLNFGTKQFNIAGAGIDGLGVIVNTSSANQQNTFQNVVLLADATFGGPARWDFRGGTPLLDLAGHTLTKTNVNQISMVSPHITSGNIVIQQGTLSIEATPVFDASAGTITVNPGGYLGQFRTAAGAFTRSIVLNGGGTTNLSGAGQVAFVDAPILLTANSTLGTPNGTEFFNNVISDAGLGFGITEVGSGTNLLAATNTYSGNTIVAQGILGLTNRGSIANSPLIIVTNGGTFDVSRLAISFTGGNKLVLGDIAQGTGTLIVGNNQITALGTLALTNATITLAVTNTSVPNITVTNLSLGDGSVGSSISVTSLPATIGLIQFPIIKYTSVSGTYSLNLNSLPNGFSAELVDNTANKSIDLKITALPAGTWNGGNVAVDSLWSDALNWNGTGLSGADPLTFTGTVGLNNTNDTSEAPTSITFAPSAGAFTLNGNPVTISGDIANNSSSSQTMNLDVTLNNSAANYNFTGGTSGLTLNSNLTGSASAAAMQQILVTGNAAINGVISSAGVDATAGLRLNVTNAVSDTLGLTLGGNKTSAFNGQLAVSHGVMNYGSATEAPNMTITRIANGNFGEFLTVGAVAAGTSTFNMKNGNLTLNDGQLGVGATSIRLALANVGNATNASESAIWNQTGGTLTLQGFNLGTSPGVFGANQPGATTAFIISGGIFDAGDAPFNIAVRGIGSLTITNTGVVKQAGFSTNLGGVANGITINDDRMVAGNVQSVGTLNLNAGGTLLAPTIRMTADRGAVSVNANMNFNGGTWKFITNGANLFAAGTNGSAFVTGSAYTGNDILAVNVQAGGAIIDASGFTGAINMPLLHDATLGGTADGGLKLKGPGTLTLSGVNTFTGNTIVGSGTLALTGAGAINNSATLIISNTATVDVTARTNSTLVLTSGQTLQTATAGALTGSLTNNTGSTVSPGGSATLGALTVSGNVALLGTVAMDISKTGTLTNDVLTTPGSITYGGTLNVTLLAGTPVLGDSFQLFNAGSGSGAFATTSLPSLGAGLAWNFNAANGTLSVVSASGPGVFTQPTGITHFSLNGANAVLTATNGQSGAAYYLLQSTNVSLPLSQWNVVATNVLGSDGNYTFIGTNVVTPGAARQFFILSNTNSNP
jgi:fibronectin-binding autotransporter adhesin